MVRLLSRGALAVALVSAVALPLLGQTTVPAHHPTQSKTPLAPEISAPDLHGKPFRLSSLRGKKVVVLSFFATWCPPCRMEMPHLRKVSQQYTGKPVQFLAVSIDDPGADVKGFAKQYGLTFPVLHDAKGAAAQAYKVNAIPTLFIIGKNGAIISRHEGFDPAMDRDLPKQINAAIAAK